MQTKKNLCPKALKLQGSFSVDVKESASSSDILPTLEELKTIYANELCELDKEWDDFTISEELLSSDFRRHQ